MEKKEFEFKGLLLNGFLAIFLILVTLGLAIFSFGIGLYLVGIALWFVFIFSLFGFILLEPNEAAVMLFFGKYRGILKENGFFWVNPFLTKKKMSYRARNINIDPIKVNDKSGNPVLIGLVLVWKLKDSYKALFEIDSKNLSSGIDFQGWGSSGKMPFAASSRRMNAFEDFVRVQSDAALRQVAGQYAYDDNNGEGDEKLTLRSGGEEINEKLVEELNNRLEMSGLEVVEARINYLAYAPEIAAVMLRRQQAEAIIAAREKIVEGAVSMVKMAIDRLEDEKIVTLNEDKKAAMVSNLLVVLCADESVQPVVNAGSKIEKVH